jgi:site-specific recombinase XerD
MLQKNSLRQAIDDYIINYSAEAGLDPKTVRNKREILNRFFTFQKGKPYTIQAVRDFIVYLSQNGWKQPNSIANLVRIFRAFTNFLHKRKYIQENFAQEIQKPKIPRKLFDYIAPETIEKIIVAGTQVKAGDRSRSKRIKEETAIALHFLLRTGLRINELLELRGADLNLYDAPPTFFVNSKGGNRDLLPLPMDMFEEMKLRSTQDRVFKVTKETCNDVLQRGAKTLGIRAKITNHSLRHIFATNLVKNKVPIQYVSRLMRHSSVEITNKTYTHLDVNDLSIMLNSSQSVIRQGLNENQVFDMLEQVVTSTKIKLDTRFNTEIVRDSNGIQIKVNYSI